MSDPAFQDLYPGNHCFGCGPDNPSGLRVKSRWDESGEQTICTFQPHEDHNAGPKIWLNGGIIGTVIDCHGIFTAIADAYRCEDRQVGTGPLLWYVTGALEVSYRRPVPIELPVVLRAQVEQRGDRKSVVSCTLSSEGEECVQGRVVAVRVPPDWGAAR